MTIEFHCEHCGKKIRASDADSGKKGRCPSCKQRIYVPSPDPEEVALAPVDEAEEKELFEQVARDLAAEHDLMVERDSRGASGDEEPLDESLVDDPHAEGGVALPEVDEDVPAPVAEGPLTSRMVRDLVVEYLLQMADGQLEQAESIGETLKRDPAATIKALDQLGVDPLSDPKLSRLPGPVVNGFFKQLKESLQ
jgi:hypothetical protein